MLDSVSFKRGQPIGPKLDSVWPGSRTVPLYWLARKKFSLPVKPESAELLIAVDRHYDLFVNGQRAIRQRGFFSGDQYLFAQRWTEQIVPFLKPGENTIDIVVRSDPWQNKNYRYYHPMLIMELAVHCGSQSIYVVSDASWQVAIIEGWRKQIAMGAIRTIHFERVIVPSVEQSILSGFTGNLPFIPAIVLGPRNSLPKIYLWTDPPKRTDVHIPSRVVATGTCSFANHVLVFDLTSQMAKQANNERIVIQAVINQPEETYFSLATSALVSHCIELNDSVFYKSDESPSQHQMWLPDYLVPANQGVTKKGRNTFRITLYRWQKGGKEYRLAVRGLPALLDPNVWHDTTGQAIKSSVQPLELSEQIGAKFSRSKDSPVTVSQKPFSIDVHPADERPFALCDMGQVTRGRLSMRIQAETSGRIYLAYGFSCRNNVVDCHSMHLRAVDILEIPGGKSFYEAFDIRAFRFLDLIFEGFSGKVNVSGLKVEESVFLDETGSSFETSDSKLDAIWQASRRTAQLCCDEIYVDNPHREHAQWIDGVLHPAALGYYAFGEQRKVAKALEEFTWSQQPDGQLAGYAPGKWFPRLPIQDHMALFILAIYEYFMHTGDKSFGIMAMDVILRIIGYWENHRKHKGLLANIHTVFIDWGSHIYSYARHSRGPTGALTALNAYYLGVLKASVRMASFLGHKSDASRLLKIAAEVKESMIDYLYDTKLGLFRDGVGDELAEHNFSQTTNILAVLYGAAPEGQRKAIMSRIFTDSGTLKIIPANAFFIRQAGEALFESGCDDIALRWLRNNITKMLDRGPGTLWETWEPNASVCQGTGAAPAYLFSRYLAGVYPAEPGYGVIGIDPHPGDLKFLQATLLTPHGPIGVHWQNINGRLDYRLSLPPQLEGRPVTSPVWVNLSINEVEAK